MNSLSSQMIFTILGICIATACFAFLAALYLTGKSRKDARRDIEEGLVNIDNVVNAAMQRIEKLDSQVIDTFQPLSSVGQENFSLVKQFVGLMQSRKAQVEELIDTGRLEDLFRAQKMITSPLENAGDHLTSVVFANTVLHLEPSQFHVALDTMLTSVEGELAGNPNVVNTRMKENFGPRKRKFTIRGFIQSVTGENK